MESREIISEIINNLNDKVKNLSDPNKAKQSPFESHTLTANVFRSGIIFFDGKRQDGMSELLKFLNQPRSVEMDHQSYGGYFLEHFPAISMLSRTHSEHIKNQKTVLFRLDLISNPVDGNLTCIETFYAYAENSENPCAIVSATGKFLHNTKITDVQFEITDYETHYIANKDDKELTGKTLADVEEEIKNKIKNEIEFIKKDADSALPITPRTPDHSNSETSPVSLPPLKPFKPNFELLFSVEKKPRGSERLPVNRKLNFSDEALKASDLETVDDWINDFVIMEIPVIRAMKKINQYLTQLIKSSSDSSLDHIEYIKSWRRLLTNISHFLKNQTDPSALPKLCDDFQSEIATFRNDQQYVELLSELKRIIETKKETFDLQVLSPRVGSYIKIYISMEIVNKPESQSLIESEINSRHRMFNKEIPVDNKKELYELCYKKLDKNDQPDFSAPEENKNVHLKIRSDNP